MFKKIPKVDKVMEWPGVKQLFATHPRQIVVDAIRLTLESLRAATVRGETDAESFEENALVLRIHNELERGQDPALRRVINATGVIIHTNLGRAPLAETVIDAVRDAASGYCNLEFDLEKGTRGSRSARVEELLRRLIGAEAALVGHNNAAAVLLALSSLARGKEVIVSRG
ncbi:MAG: L-seryl-tRNA(Sec) selenium transferase, partial [Deltaproteobacteria bacterium]|nr:L-seryl-tRNA(Sec) selenium transferase [Deltaproteobacteria bacterium]